ncbi:hypothetical protein [Dyella flagellata]|uniref:Uncharacterized protein n=1 Tax=Dyella flagellata TaxID=1867833 RepID=A0ABQ5XEJ3_9GAMM|nr:hypothetical protein [Dyella flagellata]GLQ90100.1 hypothetical protein GCM10007898_36750 [Dyella flagellata]
MMLSFRRRQKPKTAKQRSAKAAEPQPDVAKLQLQHLDYDLQPLSVESLSHYIEPIVEDERFRVH